MFFHNLINEVKINIRAKELLIWLMLFPIALGTFFKIAFGSIYEGDIVFSKVKTAIVEEEKSDTFHSIIKEVSNGDDPLLDVTWTDKDKAMKLLEDGEVEGIIFVDDAKLKLSITGKGSEQSVLKSFCDQYNSQAGIIKEAYDENPIKMLMIADDLKKEINSVETIPLTEGDTDVYLQYFYNLIAMVALFGTVTGLHVSINNQANLSKLGARKNCSPTPKIISTIAALLASYMVQSLCVIVTITFSKFVLKVDLGDKLPLVYLAGIIGGIMGTSAGFFVGSIGSFSENLKVGICTSVTMILCFLSGLMAGDMKGTIETYAPIMNKLNPAALISDSFYALNLDSDYSRFIYCIVVLCIMSVIFVALGLICTRRKKYASI
ncbi:MAG: ABC transporter permease [Eubacterium sp.]|nr:ABC transporter permease [Eubacterium sp.]